jgi:hypothetical protein
MYTVTGGRKARRLSVPVQKQTEKQQQESRGSGCGGARVVMARRGRRRGGRRGGRTSGLCSEMKLHVSCACLRERVNVSVGWLLSELLELQEFGVHFQHVVAEKRDGSAWPTPPSGCPSPCARYQSKAHTHPTPKRCKLAYKTFKLSRKMGEEKKLLISVEPYEYQRFRHCRSDHGMTQKRLTLRFESRRFIHAQSCNWGFCTVHSLQESESSQQVPSRVSKCARRTPALELPSACVQRAVRDRLVQRQERVEMATVPWPGGCEAMRAV